MPKLVHLSRFLFVATCFVSAIFQGCNAPNPSVKNAAPHGLTVIPNSDSLAHSRDYILQLVQEGNTQNALRLLAGTGDENARLLQMRFDDAQEKYATLGVISFEEWSRVQAQINYGILELFPQRAPQTGAISTTQTQIQKLVSEGKSEEALRVLVQAGYEDAILLQARLHTAQKEFSIGRISVEMRDQVVAQVNYAILEMI